MKEVTDLNAYKTEIPGAAEALEALAKLAREGKLRSCALVALEHGVDDTYWSYFTEGNTFEQTWLIGALTYTARVCARDVVREPHK